MLTNEADARAFCANLISHDGMAKLEHLIELLVAENALQNLVAADSLDHVWRRHIADSLQLLAYSDLQERGSTWLDLGTGAGFPGLVLAITRPDTRFIFIESRRRRCEWLTQAGDTLALRNMTVIQSRLEMAVTFEADVISARAFAPLPKLLDLSARFSTSDTLWLLPKGRSARQEILDLPAQLQKMFHVEPSQTASDAGIVVGRGKVAS